jgi:NADP-reducing hydrogenase subunit HndB
MAKLTIADLKKIKDKVHSETALREGGQRAKITVHMGTCGVAAGARTVMDSLMSEIAEAGVADVIELLGKEPIVYGQMDANKMRQVFKRHIQQGEVQTMFAIARG